MANHSSTDLFALAHDLRAIVSNPVTPASVKSQAETMLAKYATAFTAAQGIPVGTSISIYVQEDGHPTIGAVATFVRDTAAPYVLGRTLAEGSPASSRSTSVLRPVATPPSSLAPTSGAGSSKTPRWLVYVLAAGAGFGAMYFWLRRSKGSRRAR